MFIWFMHFIVKQKLKIASIIILMPMPSVLSSFLFHTDLKNNGHLPLLSKYENVTRKINANNE